MTLWVKICGNTSLADSQLATDAGANAVGFVFAQSPRQVTPDQVAAITTHLPASLEKIGVFVDAGFDAIARTVAQCGLTGVQLHEGIGSGMPGLSISGLLREKFGEGLRVLRVIHFGSHAAGQLENAALDPYIDAVLVDSRTATAVGGTGIAFNWDQARATIFQPDSGLKLIVAGGLSPANVADAIAKLRPWGVDVVSGVEAAPGRKDPAKVREFVANARAATSALPR